MSSSPKTLTQLCCDTEVKFGTSGVRAPIDALTPEICRAFTQAFYMTLCPNAQALAIGIDLRPSSPSIAQYVTDAAHALGIQVIHCGALPTPALAYFAQQRGLPAIMITGSHIPFDRNGLKFYTKHGEITKAEERAIMQTRVDSNCEPERSHPTDPCLTALSTFQARYQNAFPANFLNGKRIGLYEHSSVARGLLTQLLQHFGASVVSLERTDHFVPIDTEAVSEADQQNAHTWSAQYNLDAIVSTDGDGDRPLIADENGTWLRGDIVGILTCQYLNATHIATPLNSNTMLEGLFPAANIQRTRIGSPYVIKALAQLTSSTADPVVGFEANGGVILAGDTKHLTKLPTRDAVLPILAVLAISQPHGIAQRIQTLPQRYTASDRLQNIDPAHSQQWLEHIQQNPTTLLNALYPDTIVSVQNTDTRDGLRLALNNQDIIHLRASGNANELRCYAESHTPQHAKNLTARTVGRALARQKKHLSR